MAGVSKVCLNGPQSNPGLLGISMMVATNSGFFLRSSGNPRMLMLIRSIYSIVLSRRLYSQRKERPASTDCSNLPTQKSQPPSLST
jgi:hypothetical protein